MPTSSATEPSPRRAPVLAGAPLLIGFAFMMGIVMTVVFPTGREYAEVADKEVNAFSIAYLTVLTRASPEDLHLRLIYVKQLASLGRWDEAMRSLNEAPEQARRSPEVRIMKLELGLAKARALPEAAPERETAFDEVHAELASLVNEVPKSRADELGTLALELEDPTLAARFFLVAAEQSDPELSAAGYANAGRWMRAGEEGERSADCYLKAAAKTRDPKKRLGYLLEASVSLEGSKGACAAADVLQAPAEASEDVDFVRRTTAVLRSCTRAKEAKVMGRKLMKLAGDDEDEMKLQVRRELEAGDAQGALVVLKTLVGRHPNDPILREATARIAEWAGDPQTALSHWLWLFDTGRVPSDKVVLP